MKFGENSIVYHAKLGKGTVISYKRGLYDVRFGEVSYSIDEDFLSESDKGKPITMSKPKGVL